MGITRKQFPFPCFFKDIKRIIQQGRVKTVLVILDSDETNWNEFWEVWEEILVGTQITIICSEDRKNVVGSGTSEAKEGSVCIKVGTCEEGKPFADCVSALLNDVPSQDLILSSSPYDPYGEHVKTELEKALLAYLRKWEAVFLLHDPHFQVIRVADFKILRDRIFWRPWRIKIYTYLVLAFFRYSPPFLRNIQEGWITTK